MRKHPQPLFQLKPIPSRHVSTSYCCPSSSSLGTLTSSCGASSCSTPSLRHVRWSGPLCSQGLASTGVFVANESNTAHQSSWHIPSQGLEEQRRRTWTALVYLQSSSAKSETSKGQGGRCAGGWRRGWREGYFIATQVPYPTSYRTKAVLDE